MKILNAQQLSQADNYTIKKEEISSWELMERAAKAAFQELIKEIDQSHKIYIFCGPGNNGGDGLAIAYFLEQKGFDIEVFIVNYTKTKSKDFQSNEKRILKQTNLKLKNITTEKDFPIIDENTRIVDAIFGVGLDRPMPDFVQKLVAHINSNTKLVYAIDVPSGMYLDRTPEENEKVIQSSITFSFQQPKLPFLIPNTAGFAKEWKIVPIGLDQEFIQDSIETNYYYLTQNEIFPLIKKRNKFSHKGDFGHLLAVGGKYGMMGSIALTTKASMRSGVGKTTCLVPYRGVEVLQILSPETMVIPSVSETEIAYKPIDFVPSAIVIGPGIGTTRSVLSALEQFIVNSNVPILVDADGINLLTEHHDLLNKLPKNSVLTPHPGELKRLIGAWKDDFEKLEKIKTFCQDYGLILVAKEAHTLICDGRDFFFNSTGNPGMSTAGSGDVLAGIIGALMAQDYQPLKACQLGVFIHGFAGDLAQSKQSETALIASDIIDFLPEAFRQLSLIND
ncbi:MAG: NAD(P)H-hydrate dehydratase [Bacteroidota bacterium]